MRHASERNVEAIMPQHQNANFDGSQCLEILFPSHPNHHNKNKIHI